jgi:hypothetical protein
MLFTNFYRLHARLRRICGNPGISKDRANACVETGQGQEQRRPQRKGQKSKK